MTKKQLLLLGIGVAVTFSLGYGAMVMAWPIKGKNAYDGYFTGAFDTSGDYVLRPDSRTGGCSAAGGLAVPNSVNNPGAFINFILCKLNSSNGNVNIRNQERTGAAFIIQTMIGQATNRPPTAAQIADWQARVNAAGPSTNWNTNYSFTINSFFQGTPLTGNSSPNDDAFFPNSGSGAAIIFPGGYVIRRLCANPVGNGTIGTLPPGLNWTSSSRTTVTQPSAKPGVTVRFDHFVKNNGPTAAQMYWSAWNSNTNGLIAQSGLENWASGEERYVFFDNFTIPANAIPNTQYCEDTGRFWAGSADPNLRRGVPACVTVEYDFNLRPIISILVNGAPPPAGGVVEQGDTVQFQYSVLNSGSTISTSVNCTVYKNSFTGYHAAVTPAEPPAGWTGSSAGTGCPRTFPGNNTNTPLSGANETIVLGPGDVNKSECRELEVNPATYLGPPASVEGCVQVGAKPYLRVYGGDVSVGNGWPTTCVNSASSIVTWNKESPTFRGAGVRYAAMAIGNVNDFATALGNSGGAAAGQGLSFANTTASGTNIFGGSFGTLPCIPDYFGRRTQVTTTPLPSPNLSSLSGLASYTATGPLAIGGNINPNQRSVLYVDGDVLITNDIRYVGSWNAASVPLFQLVVRGDIYVSSNVTQLDGIYIAQPSTATNGVIYTCADTALPPIPVSSTDTAIYSRCHNKLTIDGSFISRDVQFMRTAGTLSQSNAAEPSSSPNIAEVFSYSPALWMAQPPTPSDMTGTYDAITSLPPVL